MTYSILGFDPNTGEFGVAVATKFLSVGAGVPAVNAYGAMAVQAMAHPQNNINGLALLREEIEPTEIIARLTDQQVGLLAPTRQLGIVDRKGRLATFTGDRNGAWSGGQIGTNCVAQGNMLTNGRCTPAMIATFQALSDVWLPRRLALSLLAGEEAGGDSRGRQSAALQVHRPGAGGSLQNFRHVDLRADDHATPCHELLRLLTVYDRIYGETELEQFLPLDSARIYEIQTGLTSLGEYAGPPHGRMDDETEKAWTAFLYQENFRFRRLKATPGGMVDPVVLARLRDLAVGLNTTWS